VYKMQQVFKIIEELRNLSGNAQLEHLSKHKSNDLLKEILIYTYDCNKVYKLNEAKLLKGFEKYDRQLRMADIVSYQEVDLSCWLKFKSSLDWLSKAKGVKECEIDELIKTFYDVYDRKQLDVLFKGVLLKDLRINMGISSFQKVWSDFCVVPTVMLAKKFEGKKPENPVYSRKYDGLRAFYLNGKFYSRTAKELNSEPLKHVLDALKDFPQDKVLDGEMIYFNPEFKEDFQKTVALVSKEQYQSGCEYIYYVIFDMLDKEEFLNKKITKSFKNTYSDLLNCFDTNRQFTEYGLLGTVYNEIKIVAQFEEESYNFISDNCDKYKWEGLMIRDLDKPYECKRTSNLQKIKKMQDAEFELVGFEKGTGKFENTLGSLIIKLETGETVNVGSGFMDKDREYIWNNQDEILKSGKLVKVQFFENTVDKHGNNSLRFPVFKCFRDKNGEES